MLYSCYKKRQFYKTNTDEHVQKMYRLQIAVEMPLQCIIYFKSNKRGQVTLYFFHMFFIEKVYFICNFLN